MFIEANMIIGSNKLEICLKIKETLNYKNRLDKSYDGEADILN